MLMMKIKLFSNKKFMFYKILLLKINQREIYNEKFLALIFGSALILGACGNDDTSNENSDTKSESKTEKKSEDKKKINPKRIKSLKKKRNLKKMKITLLKNKILQT